MQLARVSPSHCFCIFSSLGFAINVGEKTFVKYSVNISAIKCKVNIKMDGEKILQGSIKSASYQMVLQVHIFKSSYDIYLLCFVFVNPRLFSEL